jgi:hypothetical protein
MDLPYVMSRLHPPYCMHTEDGSETEAVDCWEFSTLRHVTPGVNDEGIPIAITVGTFCAKHSNPAPGTTAEPMTG